MSNWTLKLTCFTVLEGYSAVWYLKKVVETRALTTFQCHVNLCPYFVIIHYPVEISRLFRNGTIVTVRLLKCRQPEAEQVQAIHGLIK